MVGIDVPQLLFFLGPMELALIGLVFLVLVFGAKAPDIAGRVGESVSKIETPKRKLESEIEDLKGTPDQVREDMGIDEDLEEIQEGVEEVQQGIDPNASPGEANGPPSTGGRSDDNV